MNKQKILDLLNTKGIKPTMHRIAVYEELSKMMNHPNVDEIYNLIKIQFPTISLATVYSILKVFEENDIVSSMNFNNSSVRYDIVDIPHFHLYDKRADRIIDYMNEELNLILEEYFKSNKIEGYNLLDIKMELIVEKK